MKRFQAGNYINQGHYKSFQPELINRRWAIDDAELISLLLKAERLLGGLDMFSGHIPSIDIYYSMHVVKEATQSSKIEGTKTELEDALLDKEDIDVEKRNDWDEVQNYIQAQNTAISDLKDLPLSSRLIKKTHHTLLSGVRGENKLPGEYRTSQNWIGGSSINNAVFIPPVHTSVNDYMSDLENFIHNDKWRFPDLLKIALIHYQFETVHPFLDGNGRVGRLIIVLYLIEKKILKQPILYLSDYFERNRTAYYENLMRVRLNDDILNWFKFFLLGFIETADIGIKTFDGILNLQKEVDVKLDQLGSRASHALKLIERLYERPLTDAQHIKEVTGLSFPSVYNLIDALENLKILKEITGGKRGKLYLFQDYVNLYR